MMAMRWGHPPAPLPMRVIVARKRGCLRVLARRSPGGCGVGTGAGFPSFLPKEVEEIKDPFARTLAQRIERLPVQVSFLSLLETQRVINIMVLSFLELQIKLQGNKHQGFSFFTITN